jgi:hypothetical protein
MFAEVPPFPLNSSTLEVLKGGNERQRAAYRCVNSRRFLSILSDFRGVLASTIALGIDTPNSDLDFLCETSDLEIFSSFVNQNFGTLDRFQSVPTPTPRVSRCFSFWCDGFEIEIFGSLERLESQLGFRPHVAIARLIKLGGNPFRTKLRNLKLQGVKTEPAIAQLLSLSGNPYESVASLTEVEDEVISRLMSSQQRTDALKSGK